jgi:hypothetical protein
VLSLNSNSLGADGGKALADGLKDNKVITELNISSNRLGYKTGYNHDGTDMSGVIALADVIPGMGALSKLIFGGDMYWNNDLQKVIPEPAILEVGMTEADFSNKNLGAGGATIISAWITHKDKGALTKIDLSRNNIPSDQEGRLQRVYEAGGTELAI